jgi:hypothetical protein
MFRTYLALSFAIACALLPVSATAQQIRFSGFGDFTFGSVAGQVADPVSKQMFDLFGSDPDPVNTTRGFGLTGTDFVVIADMSDNFTFLGEMNLQTGRGGSSDLSVDVERFFVDYRIDPRFSLQAGLFFTPIGYNNRFLYARAWLMNSIQVPDFFEEELNLFPTHSVGVNVHGEFPITDGGQRISYMASVSNGRARTPDRSVYARDFSSNKEVTGLVEWLVPGYRDSRFGVSGWTGRISSLRVDGYGDVIDGAQAQAIELRESGLDAYAIVNTRAFSINAEYVGSVQKDQRGELAQPEYRTQAGLVEFALHLMKGKLHPYLRYDRTSVPDGGGPYISMREDAGQFTKVFVPDFEAVMTGAAYDLNVHCRLKAEYAHHLRGPRQAHSFAVQTAFGF